MAPTLLQLLCFFLSFTQILAIHHFPQLLPRAGLTDLVPSATPVLKLHLRQFDNSTATATSASLDADSSPDPTPDATSSAFTIVLPSTVISGAEQTSAAKQIGPVLEHIWNNRDLLNDGSTKQQYIDLIDRTKDDITKLVSDFDVTGTTPSECSRTSLKRRSLISNVLDTLKSAVNLVTCAEQVLNNLSNAVKSVPPNTDVIDLLTDTLNDIKSQIDQLDNDDNNNGDDDNDNDGDNNDDDGDNNNDDDGDNNNDDDGDNNNDDDGDNNNDDDGNNDNDDDGDNNNDDDDNQSKTEDRQTQTTQQGSTQTTGQSSSQTTTASSACTSSTVTDCRVDLFESTTFFVVSGSTTTSDVTTSSSTICQTITACSVEATTQTTTIATATTATSSESLCNVENCAGDICPWQTVSANAKRRRAPIDPEDDTPSWKRLLGLSQNQELTKRALEDSPTSKGSYVVKKCDDNKGSELDWAFLTSPIVSGQGTWGADAPEFPWIQGIAGCTAIIITSKRGYWYSHIIENGFTSRGTAEWAKTLSGLQSGDARVTAPGSLTGPGGILETVCSNDVQIYVMSKQIPEKYDPDKDEDIPARPAYPDKVAELTNLLHDGEGAPLAGATLNPTYWNDVPGEITASGRVLIEYDPAGMQSDSSQAAYRVWLEDQSQGVVKFPVPGSAAGRKRDLEERQDGGACSISTSTHTSSSNTGASSQDTTSTTGLSTSDTTTGVLSATDGSQVSTSITSSSSSSLTLSTSSTSQSSTTTSSSTSSSSKASQSPPTVPSALPTSTRTTAPPYSPTGTDGAGNVDKCHIHVWEHQLCDVDEYNLGAVVQIWDAAGRLMFGPSNKVLINDVTHGFPFITPLQDELVVTGEHQGDYVQFSVGSLSWQSTQSDRSKPAYCNTGAWDMKSDTFWGCSCDDPDCPGVRQMDCWFACPWHS